MFFRLQMLLLFSKIYAIIERGATPEGGDYGGGARRFSLYSEPPSQPVEGQGWERASRSLIYY